MFEFEDSFKFNSVVVLESLPPGDFRTGTELYDQILVPAAAADRRTVVLEQVPDMASFRSALSRLAREAKTLPRWPVVHIEAHGHQGVGLLLANGDRLRWEELFQDLAALNLATRFNLLVVVSACWGADLVGILRPDRPAPVWALIGPTSEMPASQLLAAFKALYSELLASGDGVVAIEAMRGAIQRGGHLAFLPAEIIFRAVFFRYVIEHCQGVPLQQRIDSIFEAIVEKDPGAAANEASVRKWLETTIDDHAAHFERRKADYFMFAAIPENRLRIKCQYSDGPPAAYRTYLSTHARPDR